MRQRGSIWVAGVVGLTGCLGEVGREPEALHHPGHVPPIGFVCPVELSCEDGECAPDALWGFADLHAHPSIHFAFGGDSEGRNGPIYGAPGMAVTVDSLAADLAGCDGDKHADSTDAVLDTLRTVAYNALEGSGGTIHRASGAPGFAGWPHAQSPTHQQMHVQWLDRAWRGGLRLLVASVTENQVLETFWTRQTGLAWQDDLDDEAARDLESARRQLEFIRRFVEANADWMELVGSPAHADCVISQGKLAVVLALEMDSLTPEAMVELARTHGARLVTPIHLRDHPQFGGMAAYSNLFNAASKEQGGTHVAVREDPTLRFRFAAPRHINDFPVVIPYFGNQTSVTDDPDQCTQRYELCRFDALAPVAGHSNGLGLRDGADAHLLDLVRAGLILDLAHMSDQSQDDTLDVAEEHGIPVIDSHTGLRPRLPSRAPATRGISERSLAEHRVERIGELGGVIGLGTEVDLDLRPIARSHGAPLLQIDVPATAGPWNVAAPRLRILLRTGDDGLRSESSVDFRVRVAGGRRSDGTLQEQHGHEIRELGTLEDFSLDWVDIPLEPGTRAEDVRSLMLRLRQGHCFGCTSDNWDLDGIEVYYLGGFEAPRLLLERHAPGTHVHRFTDRGRDARFDVDLEVVADREVVEVELWTGDDDLRCGSDAVMRLAFADGTTWSDPIEQILTPRDGQPNGGYHLRPLALPEGRHLSEVVQLGIRRRDHGSCDVFAGSDNWDLERIRVSTGGDRTEVILDRSGWPVFRFSNENPEVSLPLWLTHEDRPKSARFLWLRVKTGNDDLQAGRTATATVRVGGVDFAVPLNLDTLFRDRATHDYLIDLGSLQSVDTIESVTIAVTGGGDRWKIASLELHAIGTPMRNWWREYEHARALLGGSGVAFGTDLNGLALQLPYSEVAPEYPIHAPGDPDATALDPQSIGSRAASFQTEGLSNVGQLPDWIAAAEALDRERAGDTAPVFRSARDFVQMWYRHEAARRTLD